MSRAVANRNTTQRLWLPQTATITSNDVFTGVYNRANRSVGDNDTEWFYSDDFDLEADIAFNYFAGYDAPPAATFFYDLALTTTNTSYGEAEATVTLAYRNGTVVAIQGPSSPAPGSNATWSLSVENAAPPYTYRWFKNDVELADQTSSSLQLPITTEYFTLKAIAASTSNGADTLVLPIVPSWQVTINGMAERSPNLYCPFSTDPGNNPNGNFTYQWTLDGISLSDDGPTSNPSFSLGSHTLEVSLTDGNGYRASAAMIVNVTEQGPSNCE
jgi:hypothetical protein